MRNIILLFAKRSANEGHVGFNYLIFADPDERIELNNDNERANVGSNIASANAGRG